jgi:hypothetical protein
MKDPYDLKPISKQAIPGALAKAERYRLLNEPGEAESICRDVLRADPDNQDAIVMLILALTDQFGRKQGVGVGQARDLLPRLGHEYERAYYAGVISERWGKAQLRANVPGDGAYHWLREAMASFEKAMTLRPAGNEEAVLRWNACARLLNRQEASAPGHVDAGATAWQDEEVPPK